MVSSPARTGADAAATSTVRLLWGAHQWSVIRLLSPVLLVVAWQLLSATGLLSADVVPAPQLIVDAGWQLIKSGKLVEALQVSGVRVVEGLLFGGLTGVALGVAVGLSPWVEARQVDPKLLETADVLGFSLWQRLQRLADLFAKADQIPEAPDFVRWVDRRFNSMLPVSSTA
ncbi:ABC transporter permease [Mycobacterium cookii]|nr:hypothetical protein [Mycobacterium cookii]MCV7332198.1 hypothetical protein [Mycobacterium cookii]